MKYYAPLVLLALLATLSSPGIGRPTGGYPKLLAYSHAMGELPAAVRDTIARYDVVVCQDRPEVIADMRERNPLQRYLWEIQPQTVLPPDSSDAPWWLPDTLWNLSRLCQYYAEKNDWYLRDVDGNPMDDGHHRYINWTRYCPVGTFGSAKGLRASQWVASVAMPAIALSNRYWDTWRWDSRTAYNGIMFEILADCFGSYGHLDVLSRADPNRDGIAEGVSHICSQGGDSEPLTILFREENEDFYARLTAAFPADFVFTINENTSLQGPWWRTKLSGQKLENWLLGPPWTTWWDYFYGMTPPWLPDQNWGGGYAWIEGAFDKPVADSLKGWDLSYIVTAWDYGKTNEENLRHMRLGMGTTLLGDGYFTFFRDDRHPLWPPEFDWNLGTPVSGFARELYQGDTLYVRPFTHGMVEVNPYEDAEVNGVPPGDSRFTFWLPVTDLHCDALGRDSIRASFTTPRGEHNEADSYELRYATFPLTIQNWEDATPYSANPIVVPPGTPVTILLDGLDPGTSYSVGIRTHTRGRPEPVLSNIAGATTESLVDTTPPGSITDLRGTDVSLTWIDLAWTATGDNGSSGRAASYQLRYLRGDLIDSESKWDEADSASNLPAPQYAGSPETYRLEGLAPGEAYGIAVRAIDEAGNMGEISSPFSDRTGYPPPPTGDDIPPAAIADLAGQAAGEGKICILWTAPGDDGDAGRATDYEVRILPSQRILTDGAWDLATPPPEIPPSPGYPGAPEAMVLARLRPGEAVGVAIRARDEAGNLSAISNSPLVQAGDAEPPTEDPVPPAAIRDLAVQVMGDTSATLKWTAPGDDGDAGIAARYDLRILEGHAIASEADWSQARSVRSGVIPDPAPAGSPQSCVLDRLQAASYGAALRAIDDADNVGPLGTSVIFRIGPPDQSPPAAPSNLRVTGPDDEGELGFEWDPSPGIDIAGYNIYGRRAGETEWGAPVNTSLIPAGITSVTLPTDREEFCVTSVDTSGNESVRSEVATLRLIPVTLSGPFPHPVRESCRFEIRTPSNFGLERLRLTVRDLQNRTIREIYSASAGPSETIIVTWDRRDEGGRIVAPGFYVTVLHAGGTRILRKIFLSP